MNKNEQIKSLITSFRTHSNLAVAEKQKSYLKNQFSFLGIPQPLRKAIQRNYFKQFSFKNEDDLCIAIDILWSQPEREFCYVALDLIQTNQRIWTSHLIDFFEQKVRTHSWWDTVDHLAANCVGLLVKKFPHLKSHMDLWITDSHLWIRRSALLFQLKWKQETDSSQLFNYCKQVMHEKEFFIRKAIGWALREYGKTEPQKVLAFVNENRDALSSLSVREALRRISL